MQRQLLTYDNLGFDKAILPFIFNSTKPFLSVNLYFLLRLKPQENVFNLSALESIEPMHAKHAQLIKYSDHVTGVRQLSICSVVAPDLLAIAHDKNHHKYVCCYEIISHS